MKSFAGIITTSLFGSGSNTCQEWTCLDWTLNVLSDEELATTSTNRFYICVKKQPPFTSFVGNHKLYCNLSVEITHIPITKKLPRLLFYKINYNFMFTCYSPSLIWLKYWCINLTQFIIYWHQTMLLASWCLGKQHWSHFYILYGTITWQQHRLLHIEYSTQDMLKIESLSASADLHKQHHFGFNGKKSIFRYTWRVLYLKASAWVIW